MNKVKDVTITSLETLTVFDYATGNYKFTLDELQNFTMNQSNDETPVRGRGGRELSSLKRNKALEISGNNGLISGGLLEVQAGSDFENKATKVLWTDHLVVNSGAASTKFVAVGTTGAEIISIYTKDRAGNPVSELSQAASAAAGKFTYNPETKALGFHTDITDGTEIAVTYKRKIVADTVSSKADKFAGMTTVYGDAFGEDECGNTYRIQLCFPKVDFSATFELGFGEDQAVHAFSARTLAGGCGAGNDNLWTYTIFGADAEDASN